MNHHYRESNLMNESFTEDEKKKVRKLRKYLRQIEHLKLLTRPLNEEEKSKVANRYVYRKELDELTARLNYSLDESVETFAEFELNQFKPNDLSQEPIEEENKIVHEKEERLEEENIEREIDQLTESFKSLAKEEITESKDTILTGETANQPNPKRNKKQQKKVQQQQQEQAELYEKELKKSQLQSKVNVESSSKALKIEKPKAKLFYDCKSLIDVHENLVTCLDIDSKASIVVTGSRDTTIKVWDLNNLACLASLGGHSNAITQVKLWSYESFLSSKENLFLDEEEIENAEDVSTQFAARKPLILSSSLDCSIRLWSIDKAVCLKEFYLYNPVHTFDLQNHLLLVGLNAGKVEYWKNMKQISVTKVFDDSESICCVKLLKEDPCTFFILTQNGLLKKSKLTATSTIESLESVDLYETLRKSSNDAVQYFKCFELMNENQLLIINHNQSFILVFDFTQKDSFQFISTNKNSYDFTSSFFKLDSKYFISGYNVDQGTSFIHVFEQSKADSTIKYELSLKNNEKHSYCISSICAVRDETLDDRVILATSSNQTLTIWTLDSQSSQKQSSVQVNMCPTTNFNSELFEDDDIEDDTVVDESRYIQNDAEKPSKSYCLLQ